jgi:hypothetical protein
MMSDGGDGGWGQNGGKSGRLPPSSFLLPLLPLRFPFSRDERPLSIESRNEAATGL